MEAYASSGGAMMILFSPTFMSRNAWSHALMTWPAPTCMDQEEMRIEPGQVVSGGRGANKEQLQRVFRPSLEASGERVRVGIRARENILPTLKPNGLPLS
jgi:hypothetical protein